VLERHLEHRVIERDTVFHEFEAGLVEVATRKTRPVLQVVLQ
jgi:hypothetical protein